MGTPYVGEIRMFGFPRIPNGWHACDGTLLAIAEYDVLYNLIGTTYGGDGQTTFGLPDLRGRVPLHQGTGIGLTNRPLGQLGGAEDVTLTVQQMPAHTHPWLATQGTASAATPGNSVILASPATDTQYLSAITGYTAYPLAANTVSSAGGSQPHMNIMPTLTVNFCISLFGIYPSQS